MPKNIIRKDVEKRRRIFNEIPKGAPLPLRTARPAAECGPVTRRGGFATDVKKEEVSEFITRYRRKVKSLPPPRTPKLTF